MSERSSGRIALPSEKEQRAVVGALRRAYDVLRSETGMPDLSASWAHVLLLIAEHPGKTLSWIESETGMRTSSAHRIVAALGGTTQHGKTGLGLIESVADPRHATRKLFFLTLKGRATVSAMLSALTGINESSYAAPTAEEYLRQFESEQAAQPARVDVQVIGPQEIANAKRALARRGDLVGPHIVAFSMALAAPIMKEIKEWVEEGQGGKLHLVPTVGKPQGVAIADFPSAEHQVFFYLRWRGPAEN